MGFAKWDSPASTYEVLSQAISHLKRNSEVYSRGDSPEPEDLEAYRIFDPSRGGSLTNEDEIVTAGEGQAPIHRRKYREESSSCVCTGVEGPNGVFTNTRSRSSSRAPEARNGSAKKKATTTSMDTRMRSRSSSRAPEARNGSDSSKGQLQVG